MRLSSFAAVVVALALTTSVQAAVSSQITAYQPYPFYDNPNVVDGTVTTVPIVDGAPNQAPYGYVVYLPPGYNADTTTNWPVVFCLQGVGEFGTGRDANHLYTKMITSGPLLQIVSNKWDFPAIVISPQAFSFGMSASLYPPGASGGWGSSNYLRRMVDFTKANYRVDRFRVYMTGLCEGGQGTINYATTYRQDLAAAMPIQTISRPAGNPPAGQPGPTEAQRSAVVASILDLPIWMVHTWGDRSYRKENHLMWADDIVRTITGQPSNIMASYPYLYGIVAPGFDRFAANVVPGTGLPDFTTGGIEGTSGAESVGFSNCVVTPGATVITRSSGTFPSWGSYSWTGNADGSMPGAMLEIGNNAATKIRVPIYYSNTTKIFLAKPYTGTLSGSNITCSVVTPNGYPVTAHYGAQGWVWEAGVVAPTERPAVERIFTLYPANSHVWGWRWIWRNTSAWNWMFRQAQAGAPQRNDPPTITVAGSSAIVQGTDLTLTATVNDPDGDLLSVGWNYQGDASDDATGLAMTVPWATLATLGAGPVQVTARVSDGRGGTALATIAVTILNAPPIAIAGGPYAVNEGSALNLVGMATDPGGDILSTSWDINGDGIADATGPAASFSWAQLLSYGRGDGTFTAVFTVTDSNGASVSSAAEVTILNLAPTVGAGGPYSSPINQSVIVTAIGSDPGTDVLTFAWDLDADGEFDDGAGPSFSISTAALAALGLGEHAIAVRVTDSEGLQATAGSSLVVTLVLHADTQAWQTAVVAAGGTLTTAELAAHDRWRLDVGDAIAAKFRLAHMYWVQDPIAKRVPYFRTWGPAQLTVVGSPLAVALGYNFDGAPGKYIRTGIIPSTQPGFSQFDQFFMVWTFGATDLAADRPIAGARSNSGQNRTGVNWRVAGTRMEVYAGRASETDNNYTAPSGPQSGALGLRALGGSAVSYQDDVAKVTSVRYLTDAKPAAEEYVGTINGIGTAAFKGTIGCWFRGVGLTDAEYRTVHQATETLVEALSAPANPN